MCPSWLGQENSFCCNVLLGADADSTQLWDVRSQGPSVEAYPVGADAMAVTASASFLILQVSGTLQLVDLHSYHPVGIFTHPEGAAVSSFCLADHDRLLVTVSVPVASSAGADPFVEAPHPIFSTTVNP